LLASYSMDILDDFTQVKLLDELTKIDLVLAITLREDLLMSKISARRICEKCGKSYNLAHIVDPAAKIDMPAILPQNEGICDHCTGKLIQRTDDAIDVVKNRLRIHRELSTPIEEEYRKRNLLVDFELTSGVADMWPHLSNLLDKQLPSRGLNNSFI